MSLTQKEQNPTSTRTMIVQAAGIRISHNRPDQRFLIIRGYAIGVAFLLLTSFSGASAQICSSCGDDRPVKVGFTASVCSAHDYTVSLNGTSVSGIGSCTANSWMTTNKVSLISEPM